MRRTWTWGAILSAHYSTMQPRGDTMRQLRSYWIGQTGTQRTASEMPISASKFKHKSNKCSGHRRTVNQELGCTIGRNASSNDSGAELTPVACTKNQAGSGGWCNWAKWSAFRLDSMDKAARDDGGGQWRIRILDLEKWERWGRLLGFVDKELYACLL